MLYVYTQFMYSDHIEFDVDLIIFLALGYAFGQCLCDS